MLLVLAMILYEEEENCFDGITVPKDVSVMVCFVVENAGLGNKHAE